MPLLRPNNENRCKGSAALLLPIGALAGAGTLVVVAKEQSAQAQTPPPPPTLFGGGPSAPSGPSTPSAPAVPPGFPGLPGPTPGGPGTTPGGPGTTPGGPGTTCTTMCLPSDVVSQCCGGTASTPTQAPTPPPTPPTQSGLVLPACWSTLDQSARTAVAAFYLLLARFPPCPPDGSIPWLEGIYNNGAGGYRLTQAVAYSIITVASAEFLTDLANLSGGTAAGWVEAAFGRILGRQPEPAALAFWTPYYTQNGAQHTALSIAVGDSEFANRVALTLTSWGG